MLFYDYPSDTQDVDFFRINMRKREFYQNRIKDLGPDDFESEQQREEYIQKACDPKRFQLQPHQNFVREFMKPRTPYRSQLLFHKLGSGKTMTAITVGENFKHYVHDRGTKIFVLGNKISKQAFINELKTRVDGYLDGDTARDHKIAKKRITKYYHFIGYRAFANLVNQRSNVARNLLAQPGIRKLQNKDVSNGLIIIDEAHNVIPKKEQDKDIFDALVTILKNSRNTRLLLLTGTPVFDSPEEILYILYLLLLNSGKVRDDDDIERIKLFEADSSEFTTEGREFLERCRGHISYVKGTNPLTFPKRIDVGKPITGFLESTPVVRCWMSTHQIDGYVASLHKDYEENWGLKSNSQNASMIVYPDGSYGSDGFRKYRRNNTNDFLMERNLKTYSTKLYQLLQIIKATKIGTIFVHSAYVNENGIEVIQWMLEVNGYRGLFRVITGETNANVANRIREEISSDANKDGELIKILMGSKAVGEGMNLRNIAAVVIMEPHFNVSRIEQAIGRAIRHCSHNTLEPERRNVKVHRLVASVKRSNREPLKDFASDYDLSEEFNSRTTDELMYRMAEDKLEKSKRIEEILKQNALDDRLRTKDSPPDVVDESTYDFSRDVYRIAQVKTFVKSLFRVNTAWTLRDIETEVLEHFDVDDPLQLDELKKQIPFVLDIIVSDREMVRNRYDRSGYVIYRGRYYIFNLFNQSETTSVTQRNMPPPTMITERDISRFLATDERFIRVQQAQQQQQQQPNIPEMSDVDIHRELDKIRDRFERENVPVDTQHIGCYKKTSSGELKFAIIQPQKEKRSGRKTTFKTTGTICAEASTALRIKDLIRLALNLGIGRVTDTHSRIRFGYKLINDDTALEKRKDYDGMKSKVYICDLIRQKLEEIGQFVARCPTKRT